MPKKSRAVSAFFRVDPVLDVQVHGLTQAITKALLQEGAVGTIRIDLDPVEQVLPSGFQVREGGGRLVVEVKW